MRHEELAKYAKNGILNLNGTQDQEDVGIRRHYTPWKGVVLFLNNRPDIHTLNLSNLELTARDIKEFREELAVNPLKNITTLNLSDNSHLDKELEEVEKLTKQHFPNLKMLDLQGTLLLTPSDRIEQFKENVHSKFSKSRAFTVFQFRPKF